jgi:hypothetical protein
MVFQVGIQFILGIALTVGAMGQTADEYQVKAAYLYNLAKFVEWPAESFKNAQDPIAVCILGQSPIAEAFETAVRGKTLAGRSFLIRPLQDVRQSGRCQILFVGSSERKRLRSLLEDKAKGVLTVGEVDTFIKEGGVVNFKLDDGKVRLQINVDAAAQRRLKISSKLLAIAEIVKN